MTDRIDFFQIPTGYSNFLDKFKSTDNVMYNIINYQDPQTIFSYGILLIIFIYISANINFNYSILIGLLFYSILIYYLYTNKKVNYIDNFDELNLKYNMLNTNNNILKKYPNIIDFLYYMTDLKSASPSIYLTIQNSFENFILLYESCLQDINLINANFSTLRIIKNKIVYTLNAFTFNLLSNVGTKKIYDMRKTVESMLNKFMDELLIIQKKDIYYNGYNIKTHILDTDNIIPANFFDIHNQYVRNTKQYDVLNMLLL